MNSTSGGGKLFPVGDKVNACVLPAEKVAHIKCVGRMVSAVNQDEETQSMMIYNKAYQAISRVLTTMDEALDVLINRTGMVGR